ncbi:hypothetical protein DFH11DRAFT_1507998 [Phellopilus nigrolimitatus]|nr:hypothetical protein DFH11DRAFT_1507998 [Phellopilus nigrolimitatus]
MIPTTRPINKRPQAFGEGTVLNKRPRTDAQEKPKSTSARSAPLSDLFSDSGFRAKPVSSPAGRSRPQARRQDPKEIFSAFETISTTTPARPKSDRTFQVQAPPRGLRPPPIPQADDVGPAEHRKEMTPLRSRMVPPVIRVEKSSDSSTTPLTSRIHRSDVISANLTTPARKVVPFHALPKPKIEFLTAEPSTELKPLAPPKFDFGERRKMKAMTALGQPLNVEVDDGEGEMTGEALELERGLLVSPQKGNEKKKRFKWNGLAERANCLMGRSSTSFTLWQKELESRASASLSRPGRLRPDLCLRVTRVLQISRVANVRMRSEGSFRSVLALCEVLNSRTVLFSFAPQSHDSHLMGSGALIAEGANVYAWMPWFELGSDKASESTNISWPPHTTSNDMFSSHDQLPQYSGGTPVLLCSRFLILPTSSS